MQEEDGPAWESDHKVKPVELVTLVRKTRVIHFLYARALAWTKKKLKLAP